MKIATILGARPQFIKAATVSRLLARRPEIKEVLIHTGQHFDDNMSTVFFRDLEIMEPQYNLGIGGGTHGQMTGRQIEKIEDVLLKEQPDWVLVYGDTNSTLAGALAASKLHIPVAHVEAGLRSYNRSMPEEINRIVADHVSDLLFTPTDNASKQLHLEGISTNAIRQVGDVMYDACLLYKEKARRPSLNDGKDILAGQYLLATIHRAENTDDKNRLSAIIEGLANTDHMVMLPLHPRTREKLTLFNIQLPDSIHEIEPLGYLEMIWLINHAEIVVTDSGGLQKEAFFLGRPCITLREETEWTELVDLEVNQLVGADSQKILSALNTLPPLSAFKSSMPYGDGNAARRILNELLAHSHTC